jgi:centromere/kinetochore protein ZW10
MSLVLTFLNTHLFPFLPNTQREAFPRSLCKPVTTALLQHLLIPALPSSYHLLPQFLDLVRNAVEFEEEYITQMLDKSANDKAVKAWADAVCMHYEKKRRQDILESLRLVIIQADEDSGTFRVEVVPEPVSSLAENSPTEDQSWGFDSDEIVADGESSTTEESGWGFDDIEPEVDEVPQTQPPQDSLAGEDPASAWGWNDEDDLITEDSADGTAWDDPWNEKPAAVFSDTRPQAAHTISTTHPPKAAAGLEKFSSKHKKAQSNGSLTNSPQGAVDSPITAASTKPVHKTPSNPPPRIAPKEDFLVSDYIKSVVRIVENVLREGKELASSTIMNSSSGSTSSPGYVILQTASSVLDLFRALYPVKFSPALASPERSMRFSNDCLYLSGEIDRIAKTESGESAEKLEECKGHLKILGESWFYQSIVSIFDYRCYLSHSFLSGDAVRVCR